MSEVFTALYLMELVLCAVFGTLVAAAAAARVLWALHGRSRLLSRIERVLPLRSRWLRYLVGAVLLPTVVAAPSVVCFLLAQLPALPGSLVLHAALGLFICRAVFAETKPQTGSTRLATRSRCPLLR